MRRPDFLMVHISRNLHSLRSARSGYGGRRSTRRTTPAHDGEMERRCRPFFIKGAARNQLNKSKQRWWMCGRSNANDVVAFAPAFLSLPPTQPSARGEGPCGMKGTKASSMRGAFVLRVREWRPDIVRATYHNLIRSPPYFCGEFKCVHVRLHRNSQPAISSVDSPGSVSPSRPLDTKFSLTPRSFFMVEWLI